VHVSDADGTIGILGYGQAVLEASLVAGYGVEEEATESTGEDLLAKDVVALVVEVEG
jgi:hypothetical protein